VTIFSIAHPLGALMLVFGVMYVIASKDPLKNKFVMDIGILRYALAFISHFITFAMVGKLFLFFWVMVAIDLIFLILFVISRPKTAAA